MSFLTAEWRQLILANYEFDPGILKKYLPHKTGLDFWNGICYVSLVGFMFQNTKLLGISIPFHTHFEEVNLRFYVRHQAEDQWRRGVVFIKEIVPKPALTVVANLIYKEHYQTLAMRHHWEEEAGRRKVAYRWKYRRNWQFMEVIAQNQPVNIPAGSEAEFITEHYWGYTKAGARTTYEYEVRHPKWQQYPVDGYQIKVGFGDLYGPDFSLLDQMEPRSVLLAEGSPITVEPKRKL